MDKLFGVGSTHVNGEPVLKDNVIGLRHSPHRRGGRKEARVLVGLREEGGREEVKGSVRYYQLPRAENEMLGQGVW